LEIVENSIDYLNKKIDSKTSDLLIAKKFKGKKVLCLGDSFTYLAYYLKYLSNVTGCIVTSRGVNGAHIGTFVGDSYTNPPAGVNGYNDSYDVGEDVPQVFNSELLDEYDIVTVMGGTNDYGSSFPLGSIEDGVDSGTVYGHVKKVIEKVLTLKPHIKIYFCTQPYRCPNPSFHNGLGGYMPNNAGVTLEQTMEAVKKCAEYYGIPVCDFYHNGGWNSYNNKETSPGQGSYPYGPFAGNIYTIDGLHPRDGDGNGADMLGTYFGNFINLH
jgi:lysophospholipase L1-like esterase